MTMSSPALMDGSCPPFRSATASVMATMSKAPDCFVFPQAETAPDAMSRSRMTEVSCWKGLAPAPVLGVLSVMASAVPTTPLRPLTMVIAP